MSPTALRALLAIRNDMKSYPLAYTSTTPLAFFKRYYDVRMFLLGVYRD